MRCIEAWHGSRWKIPYFLRRSILRVYFLIGKGNFGSGDGGGTEAGPVRPGSHSRTKTAPEHVAIHTLLVGGKPNVVGGGDNGKEFWVTAHFGIYALLVVLCGLTSTLLGLTDSIHIADIRKTEALGRDTIEIILEGEATARSGHKRYAFDWDLI
jgi:hypothetical protein